MGKTTSSKSPPNGLFWDFPSVEYTEDADMRRQEKGIAAHLVFALHRHSSFFSQQGQHQCKRLFNTQGTSSGLKIQHMHSFPPGLYHCKPFILMNTEISFLDSMYSTLKKLPMSISR